MNKTPLAIFGLLAGLAASSLAAQNQAPDASSYFSFLNAADRQTLLEKGELTASGTHSSALPFGPRAPFASLLPSALTVSGATVSQEGFYLFPLPPGNVELGLYNALNAVASMSGIQYYSLSQKKMETLILASWRVESVEKPVKAADPVFVEVPAYQKAVVFQKDNRLGDGYSELVYRSVPGGLTLTMKNLGELKYGILPLVAPGDLQMVFIVLPLADKVAVYGVMDVKTASFFGLEHSKDENFRNRMRALAAWLGTRIAAAGTDKLHP
jgi:hypothetical protein